MHDVRRAAVLERDTPTALTTPPAPLFPPVERRHTEAMPDREKRLYDLADQARARGLTDQEWYANQNIGSCRMQVEQRINALNDWLTEHPLQ